MINSPLPHVEDLAAIESKIAELREQIAILDKRRFEMRQANKVAAIHARGHFTIEDYAAKHGFPTPHDAYLKLMDECKAGRIERFTLDEWSFPEVSHAQD